LKAETRPVLDTAAALQERQSDPLHVRPTAQPIQTEVELTLRRCPPKPQVVLCDTRRDLIWRAAMTQTADDTWTVRMRLPSVPTIVYYHFEFGDGTTFYDLRQIESLVPGTPNPIFDQWTRRPFQIAVYDPASAPPAWTQGQVVYQIFPDRFAKGERSPDIRSHMAQNVHGRKRVMLSWDQPPEIPPKGRDFYGGNLRGIIDKLDYLRDLGVDCLYLTPIFESPSNHRYDAMDYMAIDPMLGTEADLRELVSEVHRRGMRIILDAVFNHCSNDSKYFNMAGWYGENEGAARSQESPYYRWFEFPKWPKKYTGWVGVKTMPEFVECPEHEAFFLGKGGISDYWLGTGMDGWRTDVTPWMSEEFWRRFRRSARATNPEAYLIAEEWNDASHYLVGDTFDATMNYRFAWALRGFFALDILSVMEFDDRLTNWLRDTPAPFLLSQMNLIDSHDTARALTVCGGDKRRFKQMVVFLLAYAGASMICYGDEVGLQGDFAESARQPFKWDAGDYELTDFYRRILALRREHNALRSGSVETVTVDEAQRCYAFARRLNGESVYAAFNASDASASLTLDVGLERRWRDALQPNVDVTLNGPQLRIDLNARGCALFIPD
jgi:glycosidase